MLVLSGHADDAAGRIRRADPKSVRPYRASSVMVPGEVAAGLVRPAALAEAVPLTVLSAANSPCESCRRPPTPGRRPVGTSRTPRQRSQIDAAPMLAVRTRRSGWPRRRSRPGRPRCSQSASRRSAGSQQRGQRESEAEADQGPWRDDATDGARSAESNESATRPAGAHFGHRGARPTRGPAVGSTCSWLRRTGRASPS